MEPAVKPKDFNYTPSAFNQTVASAMCISDSFSIIPASQNDLVSANSIELNAAASLSDDSGVPLTTNSSISSGDSYRIEMCKFEIEMVESDGEVSQFDSLDNCSESGMSTENFNTLKKGPLAPIDPPPEFQDSPQATIVRSISKNIINNFRRWTSAQCPFEILKDRGLNASPNETTNENDHSFNSNEAFSNHDDDKTLKDSYSTNKHFYASDSVLNSHTDNIYDEPNNVLSSSLGNSVDNIESDSSSPLPSPPPPVSIKKIKQSMCPYFQDHSRYFKAIPSEQDHITTVAQKVNHLGISDIHDYDLYYGAKRKTYLHYENSNQRKLLYSPFRHSLHCHNHLYHTGVNASGNRPNSRNSLSSRLSSSHNSLSVSSANKPDDSIFITQAMSHDALLTREISDFYNVPIDSDIYALPVDMIQTEKDCHTHRYETFDRKSKQDSNGTTIEHTAKCQHKSHKHNNTNKRKKRFGNNCSDEYETSEKQKNIIAGPKGKFSTKAASKRNECDENTFQEPLHMTLNEVQQFYQTLYLNTKSETDLNRLQNKANGAKSSIETIWSVSSTRSRSKHSTSREKHVKNSKSNAKSAQKLASYSENLNNNNNNNNINALSNHKNAHHSQEKASQASPAEFSKQAGLHLQDLSPNNKQIFQSEKKSQFTLNLKQKFCSIFRFRRRHNRCRSGSAEISSDIDIGHRAQSFNLSESAEDKRKKFQSRALPPLPKKVETIAEMCEEKKNKESEPRFQFTSSIEKVKDYGWYWGPLSSEAAEKVLSNEPDGSFLVRDSSDDHYIFSLSFKLNSCVRHVRIEQDQGTFSFGSYAKFKSQTITEFIEKAVDHSRSGRYLFFLHRRPEHGPMRVQLTNPVSRFKHVQSLQHMCRFVILKAVIRKDLLQTLPLPRRLLDYLNYKHCYSEQIESDNSQISEEGPF